MRLIDADVLTKDLEYYFGDKKWSYTAKCLIKDMPTAYDIDKVVEQLEEASYCIDIPASANIHNPFEKSVYRGITLDRAIEIVKSGGIE